MCIRDSQKEYPVQVSAFAIVTFQPLQLLLRPIRLLTQGFRRGLVFGARVRHGCTRKAGKQLRTQPVGVVFYVVVCEDRGSLRIFSDLKRLSSGVFATRCLDSQSSTHFVHSLPRRFPFRPPPSAWQFGFPHCALPLHQLPGTDVGLPCKSARLSTESFPERISSCTSRSQRSSQRSHSVSSVTPCKPKVSPPQTKDCP